MNKPQHSPSKKILKKYQGKTYENPCPTTKPKKNKERLTIASCPCKDCGHFRAQNPESQKEKNFDQIPKRGNIIRNAIITLITIGGITAIGSVLFPSENKSNHQKETKAQKNSSLTNPNISITDLKEEAYYPEVSEEERKEIMEVILQHLKPFEAVSISRETFIPLCHELLNLEVFRKLKSMHLHKQGRINANTLANILNPLLMTGDKAYVLCVEHRKPKKLILQEIEKPTKSNVNITLPNGEKIKHNIWITNISEKYKGRAEARMIYGVNAILMKFKRKNKISKKDKEISKTLNKEGNTEVFSPERVSVEQRKAIGITHESTHTWAEKNFGWNEASSGNIHPVKNIDLPNDQKFELLNPITNIYFNEAFACALSTSCQDFPDDSIISSTIGNLTVKEKHYALYRELFWRTATALQYTNQAEVPEDWETFKNKLAEILSHKGAASLRHINKEVAMALYNKLPQRRNYYVHDFKSQ